MPRFTSFVTNRAQSATVDVLAIAALVLVLVSAGNAPTTASRAESGTTLYASGSYAQNRADRLSPLDPATLTDLPGTAAVQFASQAWDVSADGGTLVTIATAPTEATATVRAARTGTTRSRFAAPTGLVAPQLSRDGSRLVLQTMIAGGPSGVTIPNMYAYDTATGRQLSALMDAGLDQDAAVFYAEQIDPTARRLYALYVPADRSSGAGPWPATLAVHDLTSGAEIGRLDLPDVHVDSRVARVINQEPVMASLSPGFAVSPDGKTVAIVHADSDAVTLVDAERLTIARTVHLSRPSGLVHRLLALLPLVPRAAAKEGFVGAVRSAVFAPDGRHLYVFGGEGAFGPDGKVTEHGLGLETVDLRRDTIEASALAGAWLDGVMPSMDGHDLYVTGSDGDPMSAAMRLRRLDVATLRTEADRRFDSYRRVVLLPAPLKRVAS